MALAPRTYTAAAQALGYSTECLTVRLPSILAPVEWVAGTWLSPVVDADFAPGWLPDLIAEGAEWASSQFVRLWRGAEDVVGWKDAPRPPLAGSMASRDFLVRVPGWQDFIQIGGRSYFDERSAEQQRADYFEALRRSPVPPSVREAGEILTEIDNVQDATATLAASLMLAEKLAGRAIPGVGQVALAADALNVLQWVSAPFSPGVPIPGRGRKRGAQERAKHSGGGYSQRLKDLRRTGKFSIGAGDVLQALQTTDELFGVGLQLGQVMGFLQDALFGTIRGAEFVFPGPWNDPLNFDQAACTRSPALTVHGAATARVLRLEALRLWAAAARVAPWIGELPESAGASVLVGSRLAADALFGWGVAGEWVDPLVRARELLPDRVRGSSSFGLDGLDVDTYMRQAPAITTGALRRFMANVPSRERQAFYDSLTASTAWKLVGLVEPEALVDEQSLTGPMADVVRLADAHLVPRFDRE